MEWIEEEEGKLNGVEGKESYALRNEEKKNEIE